MLLATEDFTALVDGARIELKKGDEFQGSAKATAQLKQLGLVTDKPERKKVKND